MNRLTRLRQRLAAIRPPKQILGVAVRTWWTLVIACAVSSLGTWAAIDHSNANQARDKRRSDALLEQKFQKAQSDSEQRFQRALGVAVYSINSNACGFEHYGLDAISRAKKARDDPRSDARVVAAAKATIAQTRSFLRTNAVKVPVDFPCSTLPKNPPKLPKKPSPDGAHP